MYKNDLWFEGPRVTFKWTGRQTKEKIDFIHARSTVRNHFYVIFKNFLSP